MTRHQLNTPRLWRLFDLRNRPVERLARRVFAPVPGPRPGLLAAVWHQLHAEAAGVWQDRPYPHP